MVPAGNKAKRCSSVNHTAKTIHYHLHHHHHHHHHGPTRVVNKNRLRKCTIIGNKQLQKRKCGHFEQRTTSKKALYFDDSCLEQQQCDLHSFF